jgi:hypothetical protein
LLWLLVLVFTLQILSQWVTQNQQNQHNLLDRSKEVAYEYLQITVVIEVFSTSPFLKACKCKALVMFRMVKYTLIRRILYWLVKCLYLSLQSSCWGTSFWWILVKPFHTHSLFSKNSIFFSIRVPKLIEIYAECKLGLKTTAPHEVSARNVPSIN